MEELFVHMVRSAVLVAGATAALAVLFGAALGFVSVARPIWSRFGRWLLLGLELALATDTIGNTVLAHMGGTRSAPVDRIDPDL